MSNSNGVTHGLKVGPHGNHYGGGGGHQNGHNFGPKTAAAPGEKNDAENDADADDKK